VSDSPAHTAPDSHAAHTAPEVRMAHEIAAQFAHRPRAEAAGEIAQHIRSFWDPRMRRRLLEATETGADLDPPVADAAALLREKVAP